MPAQPMGGLGVLTRCRSAGPRWLTSRWLSCLVGVAVLALGAGCVNPLSSDDPAAARFEAQAAGYEGAEFPQASLPRESSAPVFVSAGYPTVYLLRDGRKWPIASPATYVALGGGTADGWPDWSRAQPMTRRELLAYPTAPEIALAATLEGRFVQGRPATVYYVKGARRWPLRNAATVAATGEATNGALPTGAGSCTLRVRSSTGWPRVRCSISPPAIP
jgi:hypothetical protein